MAEEKTTDRASMLHMEIKNLFLAHFDQPWLINAIEDSGTSYARMGTIRAFLSLSPEEGGREYHLVLSGIHALQDFLRMLRLTLLPEVNHRLNLFHAGRRQDKELILLKKCVLYTLPKNITRLDYLTVEYEKAVMHRSLLGYNEVNYSVPGRFNQLIPVSALPRQLR